jgi:uncharacterized membrane protein YdfJ with MMPL/SSD domain
VLGVPVTKTLGSSSQDFQDPASQEERTNVAITAATGQSPYYNLAVLLRANRGIATDTAAQGATKTIATLLATQHGFQRIQFYPATHSHALLSRDGRETVVLAAFATSDDATTAVAHVRLALATPSLAAKLAEMSVRFGGVARINQELNERTTSDLARAELLAFPLLLLLSFWFFRGLVAALLPLLVGGFAIVIAFLLLRLVNQFTPISVFSLNLVKAGNREHPAERRPDRAVQLPDGRRRDDQPARVPAAVPLLDGDRRSDRDALRWCGCAAAAPRAADRARTTHRCARAGMAAAPCGALGDRGGP